jgi:CHAT domain-containing protein
VARGNGRKLRPLPVKDIGKDTEDRPFAHPYSWAAFVLIGQAE